MPVKLSELALAFDYVDGGELLQAEAFVDRRTGEIYWRSDDLVDENGDPLEALPDDLDNDERYLQVPHRRDLNLGSRLAIGFAHDVMPDHAAEIRDIFSRKGAHRRFEAFLTHHRARDRWLAFEAEATEAALRGWCEANDLEVEA